VVNGCISRHRTHQAHVRLQLAQPNQSRIANARCDQVFALRRAIQKLRRSDYRVFVMYEVMGYTHLEIAERLSIPVGTSKWRLTIARRVLKKCLTPRNV
jgi:RNA polymerase sigma-70 factor (ECF subfamily)